MANLTFILGGARSGKSRYAQELAQQIAGDHAVLFIATAQAGDDEMRDRIARHRSDRPSHWHTIEEPLDVPGVLRNLNSLPGGEGWGGVVLIDCLTFYVVNHMLRDGDAATCDGETWDVAGAERAVHELLEAIQGIDGTVVIVSNEVGMGLVPETPLGRAFRDCAGRANQDIAREANTVIFMVAGLPMTVKQ